MRSVQGLYFEIVLISIFPIISYLFMKLKEAIIFNWLYFISCVLLFFPLHDRLQLRESEVMYSLILLATFIVVSIITFYSALEHKAHLNDMKKEIFFDGSTGLPNWHLLKHRLDEGLTGYVAILRISNFSEIHKIKGVDISGKILLSVKKKMESFSEFNNLEIFKLRWGDFAILWEKEILLNRVDWNLKRIMDSFSIFSVSINDNIVYLKTISGAVPAIGDSAGILHHAECAVELAELKQKPHIIIPDYEKHKRKDEYNKPFQVLLDCFEHDRIQLHYQPIVNLKTNEIVKVEALVRFYDGSGLSLDITPILNSCYLTGMNKKLTRLILEMATKWSVENECDIAVNIGFEDLIDPDIIKCILFTLEDLKGCNRKLTLEVLESSAVLDTDLSFNNLLILRYSGALVAIDDFGSGFANFDRIISMKPDIIKFDGSLIKQLPFNEDSRFLVSMIRKLAEKNGMETVAEHVENREILEYVELYGIDHVQGFLFGKPSPILEYKKTIIK
jgi:EAL domain-containing protein (putative c-di-GMP-specific phosphodiesterase class I)